MKNHLTLAVDNENVGNGIRTSILSNSGFRTRKPCGFFAPDGLLQNAPERERPRGGLLTTATVWAVNRGSTSRRVRGMERFCVVIHSSQTGAFMPALTQSPKLEIVNGQAVTTSMSVAEAFGKTHDYVLKRIRSTMDDMATVEGGEGGLVTFDESSYINNQGKGQPCYLLNRDAFSLVAMGFTGKQAMAFKLKYIAAFNAMEAALSASSQPQIAAPQDDTSFYAEMWGAETVTLLKGGYEIALASIQAIEQGYFTKDKTKEVAGFAVSWLQNAHITPTHIAKVAA